MAGLREQGAIPNRFRIGDFVVEPSQGVIRSERGSGQVEPKAMDVLLCLARHSPDTVSKQDIMNSVWPGTVVTEHALTRCITLLRKAIGGDGQARQLIQTHYKRGYRLGTIPIVDSTEGAGRRALGPPPTLDLDFADVFSTSSDHIYLYDRQCRYLFSNQTGAAALGLTPEGMVGHHWSELELVPEVLAPFEAEVMRAFETGKTTVNEVSYPTVFGTRWYEYVLDPVHDKEGVIVAVLAIVRNVTRRRRQ